MPPRPPKRRGSGLLIFLLIVVIYILVTAIRLVAAQSQPAGSHVPTGVLIFLLAVEVSAAYVAYQIGKKKARQELGLLLGILFNWIGVIVVACLTPGYVGCDYCREPVRFDANICPHCHQTRGRTISNP